MKIAAKEKAVFLDRDGTINEEMGYINHVSRFRIFNFVPKAIRILNRAGFRVILVTNQSGVARGYFSEQLVRELHHILIKKVEAEGGHIDKIYYCPHHPTEGTGIYRKDCNCRKPKTGMVDLAVKEFNLDRSASYMIGDRYKDVQFASKAGLKSVMVLTGYGRGEYEYQKGTWSQQPDFIFNNLLEAAQALSGLNRAEAENNSH